MKSIFFGKACTAVAVLMAACLAPALSWADSNWPARPIRIVVP